MGSQDESMSGERQERRVGADSGFCLPFERRAGEGQRPPPFALSPTSYSYISNDCPTGTKTMAIISSITRNITAIAIYPCTPLPFHSVCLPMQPFVPSGAAAQRSSRLHHDSIACMDLRMRKSHA